MDIKPVQSITEIWNTAEIVVEVTGEHNKLQDYMQNYFHSFAITQNFVIFQTLSMKIDFMKMPELMLNQEPLAGGTLFDDQEVGKFYIGDR